MKEIDFTFDRGDDEFIMFNAKNKCRPVNVTGAEFHMAIVPYRSNGEPIELSSGNGAITIVNNTSIVIRVAKEITSEMSSSRYEYSLRVTFNGYVKTLARGYITMNKGV